MDLDNEQLNAALDRLLDDDRIDWISDLTDKEFYTLSRLKIRSEIYDDNLLRQIVATKLAMAPSRDSHRVDQLIEFAKALDTEQIPPEEGIDAFNDQGDTITKAKKKVNKA